MREVQFSAQVKEAICEICCTQWDIRHGLRLRILVHRISARGLHSPRFIGGAFFFMMFQVAKGATAFHEPSLLAFHGPSTDLSLPSTDLFTAFQCDLSLPFSVNFHCLSV